VCYRLHRLDARRGRALGRHRHIRHRDGRCDKGSGMPPGITASGNIEAMAMYAGQSVAGIASIEPADAVVRSIWPEHDRSRRSWVRPSIARRPAPRSDHPGGLPARSPGSARPDAPAAPSRGIGHRDRSRSSRTLRAATQRGRRGAPRSHQSGPRPARARRPRRSPLLPVAAARSAELPELVAARFVAVDQIVELELVDLTSVSRAKPSRTCSRSPRAPAGDTRR
jgi:hypothetical protein